MFLGRITNSRWITHIISYHLYTLDDDNAFQNKLTTYVVRYAHADPIAMY